MPCHVYFNTQKWVSLYRGYPYQSKLKTTLFLIEKNVRLLLFPSILDILFPDIHVLRFGNINTMFSLLQKVSLCDFKDVKEAKVQCLALP